MSTHTSFTADGIQRTCRATGITDRRALAHLLGVASGGSYDPGQALVAWLFDLLLNIRVHDEPTRWRIIETYHQPVADYGRTLAQALAAGAEQLPVAALLFADRRHAMLQGHTWLLDLTTGQRQDRGGRQFLESLLYNLATLYVRRSEDYDKGSRPGEHTETGT